MQTRRLLVGEVDYIQAHTTILSTGWIPISFRNFHHHVRDLVLNALRQFSLLSNRNSLTRLFPLDSIRARCASIQALVGAASRNSLLSG